MPYPSRGRYRNFYPRSPCGERPHSTGCRGHPHQISIHALLAESDFTTVLHWYHIKNFYPRSPCGERPKNTSIAGRITSFLSTLSLRRATDCAECYIHAPEISIHALLAESDGKSHKLAGLKLVFLSTLSLRRATDKRSKLSWDNRFLSTLSLRRATVEEVSGDTWTRDFYPRSPCGERRCACRPKPKRCSYFYPRSPCGERPTRIAA